MAARRRRYYGRARTRTRTVYRKARRGYRKRKGLLTGNMGNILIGAGAGAFEPMIPQFLGKWTTPLVFGGLGYYFKKPVLLGIAGYKIGQMFSFGGGGTKAGSKVKGFFE